MATKIAQKIIGFRVEAKAPVQPVTKAPEVTTNVVHMHEQFERPSVIEGRTYKVKSPALDSALYVTINDVILNPGTAHELRRPYEIFINSKDTTSHQWVTALTRLMSAVFRKGGDVTFLAEELGSVFDPAGGHFSGGEYTPSLVAEIGKVIKQHLTHIGMLKPVSKPVLPKNLPASALDHAVMCGKCNTKSLVLMDGCQTCLSCGYSKCG